MAIRYVTMVAFAVLYGCTPPLIMRSQRLSLLRSPVPTRQATCDRCVHEAEQLRAAATSEAQACASGNEHSTITVSIEAEAAVSDLRKKVRRGKKDISTPLLTLASILSHSRGILAFTGASST